MALQIGKLIRKTFESPDGLFHLYTLYCPGGHFETAVYRGDDAPPPRKTVEYQLSGEWITHPRYGKEFEISRWQKTGRPDHRGESKVMLRVMKKLKESDVKDEAYYQQDQDVIWKHERDVFMEQVIDAVDKRIVQAEEDLNEYPADKLHELMTNHIRGTAGDVLGVLDNGGSGHGYFVIEKTDDLGMLPASQEVYHQSRDKDQMKVGLDIAEKGSLAKELLDRVSNQDDIEE